MFLFVFAFKKNKKTKAFLLISSERINIRVIDPFTIKPLDSKTIIDNARATRGRIITVEDHYYEGEESACTERTNNFLEKGEKRTKSK